MRALRREVLVIVLRLVLSPGPHPPRRPHLCNGLQRFTARPVDASHLGLEPPAWRSPSVGVRVTLLPRAGAVVRVLVIGASPVVATLAGDSLRLLEGTWDRSRCEPGRLRAV